MALRRITTVLVLCSALALAGCPEKGSPGHSPGDGHDHGASPVHSEGGHDHGSHEDEHKEGHGHDHGKK